VRKFSTWLGKSSGYWSSIRSQGLEISNSSLGHLVDVLTVQKLQLAQSPTRLKSITQLQQLIADEIRNRLHITEQEFEFPQTDFTRTNKTEQESYGAMPFVMLSTW
jgi:hypothetical protein